MILLVVKCPGCLPAPHYFQRINPETVEAELALGQNRAYHFSNKAEAHIMRESKPFQNLIQRFDSQVSVSFEEV